MTNLTCANYSKHVSEGFLNMLLKQVNKFRNLKSLKNFNNLSFAYLEYSFFGLRNLFEM